MGRKKASQIGWADLGLFAKELREQPKQKAGMPPLTSLPEQEDSQRIFAEAMRDVTPLKRPNRVESQPPPVAPRPMQRWKDDQNVLNSLLEDHEDVHWLIDTDETLAYRRPEIGKDVTRKLRSGYWTISAQCDLHGYRLDNAFIRLAEFLRHAQKNGLRCVRIIHGKGHGSFDKIPILKDPVRKWLARNSSILAFVEALPQDGGSGVVLALLRKPIPDKDAL